MKTIKCRVVKISEVCFVGTGPEHKSTTYWIIELHPMEKGGLQVLCDATFELFTFDEASLDTINVGDYMDVGIELSHSTK
jgi:hypothetical protein